MLQHVVPLPSWPAPVTLLFQSPLASESDEKVEQRMESRYFVRFYSQHVFVFEVALWLCVFERGEGRGEEKAIFVVPPI